MEAHRGLTAKQVGEAGATLQAALQRCMEEKSADSLAALVRILEESSSKSDFHKKYMEAIIGCIEQDKGRHRSKTATKNASSQRKARRNRFAQLLRPLTFVPFFAEGFPWAAFEQIGKLQLSTFITVLKHLKLDVRLREIAHRLAHVLMPTAVDVVGETILNKEDLIFPMATSYTEHLRDDRQDEATELEKPTEEEMIDSSDISSVEHDFEMQSGVAASLTYQTGQRVQEQEEPVPC